MTFMEKSRGVILDNFLWNYFYETTPTILAQIKFVQELIDGIWLAAFWWFDKVVKLWYKQNLFWGRLKRTTSVVSVAYILRSSRLG